MKSLKFSVEYMEKAPRMELLMRLVYWIPLVIVGWILGIVSAICLFVQFFYVLLLGKRHATLQKYILLQVEYNLKFSSYYALLTDERPPIVPEGA